MISKKDVLLVPGTIQCVQNYRGYEGLDIWLRDSNDKILSEAKCFIGHSLGANYLLNSGIGHENKFIFINPLVKKRNVASLFVRWIKFHIFEGFPREKAVPVRHWFYTLSRVLFLLNVDVLGQMCKIPRGNVVVIRGIKDRFFCDEEDVEILHKNNFKVIEVEAGHDWNINVAKAVDSLINEDW